MPFKILTRHKMIIIVYEDCVGRCYGRSRGFRTAFKKHKGTSAISLRRFAMVSMFSLFLLLIEQSPLVASLQQSQRHIVGVPWEKQHLYDSNEPDLTKWHCLNHEDIVLDISQINDGVCDCPDGSDEPGSAACVEDIFKMRCRGR